MDNTLLFLLCAAVAPVIAGLGYIFAKDKFNKEPFSMLVGAFFCGVISIIPILIVELILGFIFTIVFKNPHPLLSSFLSAFIVAAFTEECFKLFFLYGFIWRSPEFDERFDGIVYGVFVSLGFACAENLVYVFGSLTDGVASAFQISIMRAIFSIPCHFFCGVILGYYLSLAKFESKNRFNSVAQGNVIMKGLFYAILFHGIYDFILFYIKALSSNATPDSPQTNFIILVLFVIFLIFNIVFWRIGSRRIKHMANLLRQDPSQEPDAFIMCSNCGKTYESDLLYCPECHKLTSQSRRENEAENFNSQNQQLHDFNNFSSNHDAQGPNKNSFDM